MNLKKFTFLFLFFFLFSLPIAKADTNISISGTAYECTGDTLADWNTTAGGWPIPSANVSCSHQYTTPLNQTSVIYLPSANFGNSSSYVYGSVNTFDITANTGTTLSSGTTYLLSIDIFASYSLYHNFNLYNSATFKGKNGNTWSDTFISSKSIGVTYTRSTGITNIQVLFTPAANITGVFYQMKTSDLLAAWVANREQINNAAYYYRGATLKQLSSSEASYLQTQINQNNTIINQNNQIISEQDKTNKKLDDTNKKIDKTNENLDKIDDTMNDSSVDSSDDTINNLKDKISTNTVISDLILLPVSMLTSIVNAIDGSCSNFSLGSLYGTNLIMPCINIQNYVGNTIWMFIDLVFSGIFVLVIRKKFIQIFENITNLKGGNNEVD